MEKRLKIPEFKTEADEARWWAENQGVLAQEFKRAAADGRLGRGTVARRGATPTTTIRLDPSDVDHARILAERRGLKYQTYLKMILHEALEREMQSIAKS
jgi:predicted DNA binding CopG/RHH family protein